MLKDSEKNIPKYILDEMVSYLYSQGLFFKSKDLKSVVHAPISIYPSPIVKSFFDKISFYQIAFNKIIDKLSRDQAYLEEILTPIAEKDEFIRKNLEISKKAASNEHKQQIQLGIFRNDFMVDKSKKFIYQLKYNTSTSTMGFFSDGLKHFYKYFTQKYPDIYSKYIGKENIQVPTEKQDSIETFTASMIDALKLFDKDNYKDTIVVFIVQQGDRNEFDQRAIEKQLWETYKIKSRRLTLAEVSQQCGVDENGNISIESKKISLFYFRAGYTEKDYPDEDSWKGREIIELSTAIKCPNINTFLTSFKVFQYEISKPDVLKKYLNDELIVNDIGRFFVKMYYVREMEKENQKELFTNVLANVDNYIVKPFKEGGKDLKGQEISTLIPNAETEPNEELMNSIIMEKIVPPEYETLILKEGKVSSIICESEFSVYGTILSDDKMFYQNKSVSYLVATKDKNISNEDINNGVSAIDLPCLMNVQISKEDTTPITYSFE